MTLPLFPNPCLFLISITLTNTNNLSKLIDKEAFENETKVEHKFTTANSKRHTIYSSFLFLNNFACTFQSVCGWYKRNSSTFAFISVYWPYLRAKKTSAVRPERFMTIKDMKVRLCG